jgi:hypothetical protein
VHRHFAFWGRAALALGFGVGACSSAETADKPNTTSAAGGGQAQAPAEVAGSGAAQTGVAAQAGTLAAQGGALGGAAGRAPTAAVGGAPATAPGAIAAAGSGGTPAAAGAGGTDGAPEPPAVACDPADMLPEAREVPLDSIRGSSNTAAIVPAKGPLPPVVEHDPGLNTHTVYRPMTLDAKYPLVVWANGGCAKNGTMFARFLLEIASHGFVIVADGEPNGSGTGPLETNAGPQTAAIDWIVKENERPCSKYYRKLDTTKIAAMGQSCGGLMTMGVSGDARLTTIMIWNSGMFQRDEAIYMGLHTPVAYIIGGPDDVAYPQAESDFAAINNVPIFYGNSPVGHTGTYAQDNGGAFATVGIAWLKWQLYGEMSDSTSGMFLGAACTLCKDPMWTVEKKMME